MEGRHVTLTEALWARLAGDPVLGSMLATYSGAPAIVTADGDTLLEVLPTPFVILTGSESDLAFDTKDRDGREVIRVVRCYDDANGDVLPVEAIAERVRYLLHRKPVGLADGAYIAECTGPIVTPSSSEFYGREVQLRLVSLPTPIPDQEGSPS